jgi:hypothetical protein
MSRTVLYALGGEPYYRDGDDLYATDTGRHVGRFFGSDVYAPSGHYLGELTSSGRLGSKLAKQGVSRASFGQRGTRGATGTGQAGQAGIPGGFEDFNP